MKEMVYSSDPNADREILDEGYAHGYYTAMVILRDAEGKKDV